MKTRPIDCVVRRVTLFAIGWLGCLCWYQPQSMREALEVSHATAEVYLTFSEDWHKAYNSLADRCLAQRAPRDE